MLDEFSNHTHQPGISKRPLVGFQTALGSIYKYNPSSGTVSRFKVSFGPEGQGYFCDEALCFFITSSAHSYLMQHYDFQNSRYRYRLGHIEHNKFIQFSSQIPISADARRALVIYDKDKNEVVFNALVQSTKPILGLHPLDKRYFNDPTTGERMSATHVGNKITKLYHDENALQIDIQKAQFELDSGNIFPHKSL